LIRPIDLPKLFIGECLQPGIPDKAVRMPNVNQVYISLANLRGRRVRLKAERAKTMLKAEILGSHLMRCALHTLCQGTQISKLRKQRIKNEPRSAYQFSGLKT
jgi:hypothetical protein